MKGKVPIIIIAVCVLGAVAFFVKSSGTSEEASERFTRKPIGEMSLKCDKCGYEWSQKPKAEMLCPKCDTPGFTTASFLCKKCKEEFVGLETQKLAQTKYNYRRPGEEKWSKKFPSKLKCPNCGFESDIHYANEVRDASEDDEGRRRRPDPDD